MATPPLLQTHALCGSRGGRALWQGLSLQMLPKDCRWLRGANGSGKTTLLRIIAGLTPATMGEVRYKGQRVTRPQPGISMVFQTFALFPWLNVQQNVELGLEAAGVAADGCLRRQASPTSDI